MVIVGNGISGVSQVSPDSLPWSEERLVSALSGEGTSTLSSLIDDMKSTYLSMRYTLSDKQKAKLRAAISQIRELRQSSTELSFLQRAYLGVVGLGASLWGDKTSINDKKLEEISKLMEESVEAHLCQTGINTELSQQVSHALADAYTNYYSRPYQDTHIRARESVWTVGTVDIHRYNHGLAHATRKAFFIPFIIDYLLRHGKDEIVQNLQGLIDSEGVEKVIEKLQIAIIFEVAGRESECGSRDDLKTYTQYLENSSNAFRDYCYKNDLVGESRLFASDTEVELFANAIKNKYHNRFQDPDKIDVLTAILDIGHTLDEFRCYWPSRMQDELGTIDTYYAKDKGSRDLWQLAKFCQKAVRVTGDRLMTEFTDSPAQREPEYAIHDLRAATQRNYSLMDPETFLDCSRDSTYCWNLLRTIKPPVSFSRGETTFTYVSGKSSPQLDELSSSTQEALDLIAKGEAAIRLVNAQKEKFGFEMMMLNDPVYFRPTRKTEGSRDWVIANRTVPLLLNRGLKERLSLREQKELGTEESRYEYPSVHKDKDRGLPKYTEYTKKVSLTLLRPDAKIKHFTGEFPKEYGRYRSVGFLYDVEKIGKKKEKYVFDKDVGTSSKFWVGSEVSGACLEAKEGRATQLTLSDLKSKLREEAERGLPPNSQPFYKMQHAANEILMSPRKSALKAVFATESSPEARIRALVHNIYLKKDYGMTLPVLVIDGKSAPIAYSESQLQKDLSALSLQQGECQELAACFFSKFEEIDKDALFNKCQAYL